MALHADLLVNGGEIDAEIVVRRVEDRVPGRDVYPYVYQLHDREETWHGEVRHNYSDGPWVLVKRVLDDVYGQLPPALPRVRRTRRVME